MTSIRALIAASVLLFPGLVFAAANETAFAPEQPALEQALSTPEAAPAIAQDTARESEAFARASATLTKSKAVRPSKVSVARAASAPPPQGCTGYWCGRQFVLIVGIGF